MMMNDPKKMEGMLTADAMASGGVLPQSMPAMKASKMIGGLTTAFPDLKFEVQEVMVNGNQATVKANIRGTQTGTFSVPLPRMPTVPATGKKVSVKDAFVVTVQGDKVSHLRVDLPANGGIPAILAQIGVKMPGM
ncbi:MAG: ester cyclase [Anaerolineales bacterium]|jgi:predicted ester cyclase